MQIQHRNLPTEDNEAHGIMQIQHRKITGVTIKISPIAPNTPKTIGVIIERLWLWKRGREG